MANTESSSAMETSSSDSRQFSALLPSTPFKFSLPYSSAALIPILSSCYFKSGGSLGASVSPSMRMRALFSSAPSSAPSSSSPSSSSPASSSPASSASATQPPVEVKTYKLPPPVNPPDAENPTPATLRAQWDSALRMYGRVYSHAWGTAILAGVSLFGLGWWIKGENPLKALSPTGELKKEETTD